MRIGVIHLHLGRAGDLKNAIARARLAEASGDGAEHHTHIAADWHALHLLLIAFTGSHFHGHGLVLFEDGEVGVFNFHKEPLAGLELLGVLIFVAHGGTHLFQRGNRAAVMPLFEMAEANVIVGLVYLFRHGKFLDDFPHHFETLTVVAPFKKAHAHFQCGFGALLAVFVILAGHGLEMRACLFVGVALGEMMSTQFEVRLKPGFAARIPLDD